MPTNREIVYRIRMRNEAAAAIRQVTADLAAQGTTVKRVARELLEVQAAASRVGAASAQAARGTAQLAQTAKGAADAAKGIVQLTKAMGDASARSNGFRGMVDAVDNLDRVFRTSAGITAYRARLQGLQASLAALTAQYGAAAAAAASFGGTAPPRAPRGTGSAGAPPAANGPPSTGASPGRGGADSQREFNRQLADTHGKLQEVQARLSQVAAITLSAFGARRVFEAADAYTQLIGQLKLVTEGQQNLSQAYAALFAVSQNNSTALEGTVNLYSRFVKATNTLGVSQREVVDVVDAVSKSIAIFGGNTASAEAALTQFSQGLASGTLRGEELNSVLEQAPRLAQAIADGLKNDAGSIGIPLGSLRAYAEQGKLTAEEVFRALQRSRPKLEAESNAIGLTIGKAFTQAGNAAIDFIGKADTASGASKRVGTAIVEALKGLQAPATISAAQQALSAFATGVSFALQGVALLAQNLQLAVTAFVAFKTLTTFGPALTAMGASAGAAASQLLVYSVATRGVAIGASAANIAVNGLNAALRLFGGPVGIAITVATTALAYWLTQTKESVTAGTQLSEVQDKLKGSYDATTNSVKNLTEAERAREKLRLEGLSKGFGAELASQSKALNKALAPGLFEGTDGSRLAQRFMPFREEIEAFRKSVAAGKPDFDALQKAVAVKAQGNTGLKDAALEIDTAAEAGRKAQGQFDQTAATLRILDGAATQTDASVAKLGDTLQNARPIDGATALVGFLQSLKDVGANVPVLKKVQDAQAEVQKATAVQEQAVRNLKAAYDVGTISLADYEQRQGELDRTMQRARDAINGVTEAQRSLRDAERDLGTSLLVDRAKAVEEINTKYDRQIRALKEQTTDQAELNRLISAQNDLRQREISSIDTKYQNGDLRDRILGLQNEARLLGLTGEARDRASALLDVESSARKAGVSNIDAQVAAYAKEYDALQKAKDTRQTMGDGFNTALTKYLEDAKKIGDRSAEMFGQVFDHIGDGFVDVIKNGRDGFKSMLDNIASDLLRFASRQLFRSLLSSLFGDGQGGTGTGGGILSGAGTAILSAFGVKAAQTSASSAVSTGIGGTLANGASAATGVLATAASGTATAVTGLSKSVTEATGSFGDVPSKLGSMLKGLGATDAGVAGFLGNVQRESQFNPSAVNPSSGAYGLIQALGPRKAELFKAYGSSPSVDDQVAFIKKELQSTEGATLRKLQSAGTLEDGVKAGIGYERPEGYAEALKAGDLSQVPDFGKRLSFGKAFVGSGSSSGSPFNLDGATLSDETVGKLNTQFDDLASSSMSLDTSFSQTGNALQNLTPQITAGGENVVSALSSGGSQVGKAFSDVSSDVANSGSTLANALTSVTKNIGSAGGLDLGSIFGGGKSAFAIGDYDIAANVAGFHTGGIVGGSSLFDLGAKSGSLWAGAPRFHTGGIVGGLKHKERAIIAKDDEAVFPTVRMSDGNFGIRATPSPYIYAIHRAPRRLLNGRTAC